MASCACIWGPHASAPFLPRVTRGRLILSLARWNLDALLRTDTKTRYEAYQIGLTAGFLTLDHVKRQEHL